MGLSRWVAWLEPSSTEPREVSRGRLLCPQERVAGRNRYIVDSGHPDRTPSTYQERNTFQDAATVQGVVNFATIHCVVPKSFASLRTLVP